MFKIINKNPNKHTKISIEKLHQKKINRDKSKLSFYGDSGKIKLICQDPTTQIKTVIYCTVKGKKIKLICHDSTALSLTIEIMIKSTFCLDKRNKHKLPALRSMTISIKRQRTAVGKKNYSIKLPYIAQR